MQTIIFDIDNTLYSFTRCFEEAVEAVDRFFVSEFGWEQGRLRLEWKESYKKQMEVLGVNDAAIHDILIRVQWILESNRINPLRYARRLYHLFWDTLMEHMEPEEGVVDFIRKAKEAGLRLGLATDMQAEIQYKKLETLGLIDAFDWIVTSEEAGFEKPHKYFFAACLEKADCPASECLMLGDNYGKDIVGALNVGMQALHYVPHSDEAEEGVYHSYKELSRRLFD